MKMQVFFRGIFRDIIYYMDIERERRVRNIRVILVDILMVLSMVAIVVILIGLLAGYRISSDLTVQQNGLISIHTQPTGADVIIDGEQEFMPSNLSKMLSGGTHEIVLKKKGYDTWTKTVTITPGWALRLEYPRLFKLEREKEVVQNFSDLTEKTVVDSETNREEISTVVEPKTVNFMYAAPDSRRIFLSVDGTWQVISNLGGDVKNTTLNISKIFSKTTLEKIKEQTATVSEIAWSENAERAIVKVGDEWAMIDLVNINNSLNLTSGLTKSLPKDTVTLSVVENTETKIERAKFVGSNMAIILSDGELSRVDFTAKTQSASIISNVTDFVVYGKYVTYIEKTKDGEKSLGIFSDEDLPYNIYEFENVNESSTFLLSSFNSEKYIGFMDGNQLLIYRGKDFAVKKISEMSKILEETLDINAKSAMLSENSEFMVFRDGNQVVVFDAELEEVKAYDYGNDTTKFLEWFIMYRVGENGEVIAWDFDGENIRTLVAEKVSEEFPVFINSNGKYLYYMTFEDGVYNLIREKLT